MEKQKFLMEIIELSNKYNENIEEELKENIKICMRNNAITGWKYYSINANQHIFYPKNNINIPYKTANAEVLEKIKNFFMEEGFKINEDAGLISFSW